MDLKFSKVTRKGPVTIVTLSRPEAVSYTHLDVYKRQIPRWRWRCPAVVPAPVLPR